MYRPLHDHGYWWVREGQREIGFHVLPGDLLDLLPCWPLLSNRPKGMTEAQAMVANVGMVQRVYLTAKEAMAALEVGLCRLNNRSDS